MSLLQDFKVNFFQLRKDQILYLHTCFRSFVDLVGASHMCHCMLLVFIKRYNYLLTEYMLELDAIRLKGQTSLHATNH